MHLWNSVTLFQGKETVNAIGVGTVNAIGVGTVVCHGAGGAGGVVGVAKDSSCESGVSIGALYAACTLQSVRERSQRVLHVKLTVRTSGTFKGLSGLKLLSVVSACGRPGP